MVAAVRQGGFNKAKTRARAPAKPVKSAPRRAAAAPTKFQARAHGRGLPPQIAIYAALGAFVLAGAVALFTGDRLEKLTSAAGKGFAGQMAHAGFEVTSLRIKGASPRASAAIAGAAGLNKGDPILAVDLKALRERVMAVGWVEKASVVRMLPNTLMIDVTERMPVAVWQTGGVMRVIDAKGGVIAEASPYNFPELPLLVGAGANDSGGPVLELIKARPRLAERLEALVRVDDRRWDLRMKSGAIIQLPAVGEDSAFLQLDQLDKTEQVLDLDLERIDLRSPEMVVVRRRQAVSPTAPTQEGV